MCMKLNLGLIALLTQEEKKIKVSILELLKSQSSNWMNSKLRGGESLY